jgi:hypothetical protein
MHARIPRRALAAIGLTGALLVAALPALAQDDSTVEADPSGLASILPAEIAGVALEPYELPFLTLVEQADPDDPAVGPTVDAITAFAEAQGAGLEQVWLGGASAMNPDAARGVSIASLRIEGADGASLAEPFVALMLELDPDYFRNTDVAVEPAQIEGTDVFLVTSPILQDGEFDESDDVAVGSGELALIVKGDPDSIIELVAALASE